MPWTGILLVVAIGLVAGPASALDLGGLVPGLTVHPFLAERILYHSNVFQTPSRAQDDVVVTTIPGFLAEYLVGPHSLSVGYRAEILRYLHLTQLDTEHHVAVGQLRLDFPRLLVNLRDDLLVASEPPGTELSGPIESTTNVLVPEVEYRITGRLSAGASYSWTHVDFERPVDVLDRDEHLVGASLFWKLLPAADLRLSYAYGEKRFDSAGDRDVTRQVVTVGLRGDLTSRLSSTFRLGFESREPRRRGQKAFEGGGAGRRLDLPADRADDDLPPDRPQRPGVDVRERSVLPLHAAIVRDLDNPELHLARALGLAARGDPSALEAHRTALLKAETIVRRPAHDPWLFGVDLPRARGLVTARLEPGAPIAPARFRRALATYLTDRRLWDQALQEWEAILVESPNDPLAHYSRGLALDGLGIRDQAVDAFRKAVSLDRRTVPFRLLLAESLWKIDHYHEAISQWRAALAEEPSNVEARLALARAYVRIGEPVDAFREYQQILLIAPDHPDARQGLARLGKR